MQTNTADDYDKLADAMDSLANSLKDADSIKDDVPVLSELFHKARTSKRDARDGRYVALLDYELETGWSCRSVAFMQSGSHYRDTGADMALSFKPYPFLSVSEFAKHIRASIQRDARSARQSAGAARQREKDRQRREEMRNNA